MKLTIGHLYPDLLNLYGDRGNIQCMMSGASGEGSRRKLLNLPWKTPLISPSWTLFSWAAVQTERQMIVCSRLRDIQKDFKAYVEDGGTVLAVCGGYQLLGHYYKPTRVPSKAFLWWIYIRNRAAPDLLTTLSWKTKTFPCLSWALKITAAGPISGTTGLSVLYCTSRKHGEDKTEGVLYKNVVGTYLHGPLLPKNPISAIIFCPML